MGSEGAFQSRRRAPMDLGSLNCRTSESSCKIDVSHIEFRTHLERSMAQVCEICGKGPQFGNRISHAHNVTKRRWNVNLRAIRARVKGATKRIRVCTSCLRSAKAVKP